MKNWPRADRFCAALKTEGEVGFPKDCVCRSVSERRHAFFSQAANYLCAIADSLGAAIAKMESTFRRIVSASRRMLPVSLVRINPWTSGFPQSQERMANHFIEATSLRSVPHDRVRL
jgi:hypothetical protein